MTTETQSSPEMTSIPKNLHELVGLVAGNSIPTAVKRNSFIVNEVPLEFQIATDEKILASILNNLISNIVSNTQHSCIRIKAKEYDDIVCLHIRDNSLFSNYTLPDSLHQAKLLAKKMNGNVSIRNMEDKFTTILFSFPNFPKAA